MLNKFARPILGQKLITMKKIAYNVTKSNLFHRCFSRILF